MLDPIGGSFMDHSVVREREKFQEIYVEAVEEFRLFINFAADVLRGSSVGDELAGVLLSYEKADEHYKVVNKLLRELFVIFGKKTANRMPPKWTQLEKDNYAQITTLRGIVSGGMNELLSVHKISLKQDQDAKIAALRDEDSVS